MGLSRHIIRFLLEECRDQVDFSDLATLGRQELHCGSDTVAELLSDSCIASHSTSVLGAFHETPPYGEPLFKAMGAKTITSFDYSSFEGASEIHDFNQPLPDQHKQKFSAVFDGGSLEHIFNFPEAIRSCMEMVRPGGHFLASNYANNLCGHGFYQFSPELMFQIFCEENGFDEPSVTLVEQHGDGTRWRVENPESYGNRVELTNTQPTFIFVSARRTNDAPPFKKWPTQSDYSTRWKSGDPSRDTGNSISPTLPATLRNLVKTLTPESILKVAREYRSTALRNRSLKRPFSESCYKRRNGR